MLQLTDGTIIAQQGGGNSNTWYKLTPTAAGSYLNGTWSQIASMNDTRLYYSSQVLQNGNVFVAGGEYGTGGSNAEIYNPLANTWTELPSSGQDFVDSISETLPNGNVLVAPVYPNPSGSTIIFHVATNTWTQGPQLYRGSDADEQTWVKLADGSILTVDGSSTSERYIPSLNQWVNDGAVPVDLFAGGELGAGIVLANSKALFIGASGATAIYTPSGTSSPGSWVTGPNVPWGLGAFDAPAAMMSDGKVLLAVASNANFSGPTQLFAYDPTTNAFASLSGTPTFSGSPYYTRMLDLPDGGVLFTTETNQLYEFTPSTAPAAASQPVMSSVVANADGSFLLTGTQLNGVSEGAGYGDDAQQATNYPLVRLVNNSNGNVYYARSYNWSSTAVQTSGMAETTDFTLPSGLPFDSYTLSAVANGIASSGVAFTNTAPTVVNPAAASPCAVTGVSTNLSVLGAGDAGDANLTYTWSVTAKPNGAANPLFSANASNTAKNVTAAFSQWGSYTLLATITDTNGQSTTSSVNVSVAQTLSSIVISPASNTITIGGQQQFSATGFDQFGVAMAPQPGFNWSVASGGGTINASGLYTAQYVGQRYRSGEQRERERDRDRWLRRPTRTLRD